MRLCFGSGSGSGATPGFAAPHEASPGGPPCHLAVARLFLTAGLVYENPTAHNVFNTAEERSQELHDVVSFGRTRSDGSNGSDSGEHDPLVKPEAFQEPPADLEQNLKQHLLSIGETVSGEQKRFCSSGSGEDLKNLIDSCHQRTFTHLHGLLQKIQSSENCFLLLTWVKEVYLRSVSIDSH